jgi:hypothetical protein
VRPLLWANSQIQVPGFNEATTVDVAVPCSFDLNFAAAKFLDSVREGEIPLTFLFSGTVFYLGEGGAMQIAPIPWDREAAFRLPVKTWKILHAELGVPASSVLQENWAESLRLRKGKVA